MVLEPRNSRRQTRRRVAAKEPVATPRRWGSAAMVRRVSAVAWEKDILNEFAVVDGDGGDGLGLHRSLRIRRSHAVE